MVLSRRHWVHSVAAAAALQDNQIVVRAKRKPADAWQDYPTRTLASLPGFRPTAIRRSRFGGRADRTARSSGFFRAERIEGRWWLVDPDGHPFLHVGVVSVAPGKSPAVRSALNDVYGSDARWAAATAELLRGYHFNGTGNWSAVDLLRAVPQPLPYTIGLNFMSTFGRQKSLTFQQPGHMGYPGDAIPVFHPEFESFCSTYAAQAAANSRDPCLLGYFSDNELPAPADLLDKSLALDASNPALAPGRQAARDFLAARGNPELTSEVRDAFREHVYERYLALTTRAIRRHDPNHLCLGPRLHGGALRSAGILRACGRHLDVIAANIYWQWTPDAAMLEMWRRQADRPFLVTEFYAKGHDSGFPNNSGAGWLVPTQKDRALFYQNFTLSLLESKQFVGWHWFKYMDNDPTDLTTDPSNRDSNKGIVTIGYKPYTALLEHMAPLNEAVYALAGYFDRTR